MKTASRVQLIGRSAAIRSLEDRIDCAAHSEDAVLITGERGVGKETVARLVHHQGSRAAAPFVIVECAGLPDILLQSELFGHLRGSFSGAYRDKPGLLEMGSGGTVFLAEIGEVSACMQGMLLQFLESGEIQCIGADPRPRRVNVRLISATTRDLTSEVARGTFRADLFARLSLIRLSIPPLRERGMDVPLLVKYFLQQYGRMHNVTNLDVSKEAIGALVAGRWRGNVGELENAVERALLKEVLNSNGRAAKAACRQEFWNV